MINRSVAPDNQGNISIFYQGIPDLFESIPPEHWGLPDRKIRDFPIPRWLPVRIMKVYEENRFQIHFANGSNAYGACFTGVRSPIPPVV